MILKYARALLRIDCEAALRVRVPPEVGDLNFEPDAQD